jgi:heat shock protein HslJ
MRIMLLALVGLALLPGCREQRAQLGQALSGKPPVVAGSLEGEWQLADLNGGGAPAGGITLLFDPGDHNSSQVSGNSGCNRFTGPWTQNGAALKLGPLATTMMACPPPVMEVENRLLAALSAVTTVRYTEAGAADLITADGRIMRLRRAIKAAP